MSSTATEKPNRSKAKDTATASGSTKTDAPAPEKTDETKTATGSVRVPTYGGTKGAADLGANGRRLVAFLRDAHGDKKTQEIVDEAIKRTPEDDRFVRWELIAEVAREKGIADATESLVRKLARQDGAKERGLVGSVRS